MDMIKLWIIIILGIIINCGIHYKQFQQIFSSLEIEQYTQANILNKELNEYIAVTEEIY